MEGNIPFSKLPEIDTKSEIINSELFINTQKVHSIIKDLPTFLKIKGIAVYPNIRSSISDKSILSGSQVYEFLEIKSTLIEFIDQVDKSQILQVVQDFSKLNQAGYKHGDLQKNCRNMVIIDNNKIKVIDIDGIDEIFFLEKQTVITLNKYQFGDIISLCNCFTKYLPSDYISKMESKIKEFWENIFKTIKGSEKFHRINYINKSPWVEYTYNESDQPNITNDVFLDNDNDKNNWAIHKNDILSQYSEFIKSLYDELYKELIKNKK